MYLRQSQTFVPLTVYNNWMKQRSNLQRFTRVIVKSLRKSNHGDDGISTFPLLTMLKHFGENLGKPLALPSLIGPEQCYTIKGRSIQCSFHLDSGSIFAVGFTFFMCPPSNSGYERSETKAFCQDQFVKVDGSRPCFTSLCWNRSYTSCGRTQFNMAPCY